MLNTNNNTTNVGYIDMHCHIIPHVDDGAKNSSQALSMMTQAYNSGFRAMIATPHYEVGRYEANKEEIEKNFNKIKSMVEQEIPGFKIYLGNEIFFSYGVVDKLNEGEINTLAGSNYVLVEFSPNDSFSYIKKSLYEIINAGYTPVLAHTERYEEVMESEIKNVEKLVDAGVLIQINSSTLAGNMGIGIRRKVIKLIKNDLIHFISTDCHSDGRRSPDLTECIRYLQKKTDEETINRLLRDNALKVINNEDID
ncbi:MAG: capsular biosynthesis protein [Lachnospiraceae bacterium]|nr:capsular biosynthesis protein [Lachnospiraceae bacterium]